MDFVIIAGLLYLVAMFLINRQKRTLKGHIRGARRGIIAILLGASVGPWSYGGEVYFKDIVIGIIVGIVLLMGELQRYCMVESKKEKYLKISILLVIGVLGVYLGLFNLTFEVKLLAVTQRLVSVFGVAMIVCGLGIIVRVWSGVLNRRDRDD